MSRLYNIAIWILPTSFYTWLSKNLNGPQPYLAGFPIEVSTISLVRTISINFNKSIFSLNFYTLLCENFGPQPQQFEPLQVLILG